MGSQRVRHGLATKQQQQTLQDNVTGGKCVFPLQAHGEGGFQASRARREEVEGGAELWGHLVWVCFTSCDTGFREGAAELGTPRLETEGPSAEVGAPTGVCEVGET